MFTIGQRKGLPGGSSTPRYVVDIDPGTARVIVGGEEDLIRDEFDVDRANWLVPKQGIPEEVTVKIRYAHPGAPATLEPLGARRARVRLHVPQRAVTPGQAAVFYERRQGGWGRMDRTPTRSHSRMIRLILTTFANEEDAAKAVHTLVEENVAACGTILPGARSIYRWKDAIEDSRGISCLAENVRREVSGLGEEIARHPSL